jgi:hypothetical protein
MTTVPPPSTPPPQITAAPPPPTVLQIVTPPPAVAALPPGTVLEGVVVPTPPEAKPAVTVRTPQGDVTIKLPVQLPDNAKVALEILRAATANQQTSQVTQVTVRIVTVDNQPAAQVLAQLARQPAADPRTATPAPPQAQLLQIPQNDPQNPLLRAAVLPPGNAWTVKGPMQLPSLGTVSALVVLGTPSAATPQQMLNALAAGNPANTATPTPGTTPAAVPSAVPGAIPAPPSATPTAVLPSFSFIAGGEVSLRITSMTLPGATTISAPPTLGAPVLPVAAPTLATPPAAPTAVPTPTVPQTGPIITNAQGLPAAPPSPPQAVQPPPVLGTFTGTVISLTPTGMPVIDTGSGQVQINVRANLPVGMQITIDITAQMAPRPGVLPPPMFPAAAMPMSGPPGAMVGWPTLTESLAVLQRSDPVAAQSMAQSIPDGGPRTAAAMMSFAQAMRNGDARQWPGDSALRALERAGPRGAHLAGQLSDEITALSNRARDTGTEWRALPVPWNAEGHIERIALITRREGESDDDAKTKSGGGQRFIINLDLSRLGEMQLDGMFRKETRGFDLMIRTKADLPDQIRTDLMGIFATSNAAMGLKGGLTFQVVKKFADPTAGALNADKGGVWA